jgi:hypothetical protein
MSVGKNKVVHRHLLFCIRNRGKIEINYENILKFNFSTIFMTKFIRIILTAL